MAIFLVSDENYWCAVYILPPKSSPKMVLHPIDIAIIVLFLLMSLFIGLYFRKKASKSLSAFFLGDRNMPWLVAGISMVATTFAADTPLAVAELVGKNGISGNWIWWSFLAGGMLTTFFFAKLWRRSGVLTEVELIELRYGGKPAALLRGFKAVYLGLFMNVLIIGWVNLAMITIMQGFFGLEYWDAFIYLAIAMVFATIYTSLSGLWGVAVTDVVQFIFAMIGTTVLAFIVLSRPEVGGIVGLQAKLPPSVFNFFPSIGEEGSGGVTRYAIGAGAFLAFAAVQWWSSWYPGQEPGGGGYVAQRMMSTKTEKGAVYATLLFQIAHYCLRPWPWILVGLAAMVLYPQLRGDDLKMGYVYAMRDFLPVGLKGLLLASFLAAYLSTISTQLNWGAGYIANDLYSRFMARKDASQASLVMASRVATMVLMVCGLGVTVLMDSISGVWLFIIECGAGLGLVLILRWYWWRINAWSEITATVTPFISFALSRFVFDLQFPESYFFTVGSTTVVWILVTYLTPAESHTTLSKFYGRVRPDGWWKPFKSGEPNEKSALGWLALCWVSAIAFAYSLLFLTGKVIFGLWDEAMWWGIVALAGFVGLKLGMKQTSIWN